jgi:hypothetical protein
MTNKIDFFGKLYAVVMSLYFITSGLNALWDIDAKLARISLSALNADGQIAFILIYCSLMIGIGLSILLIFCLAKTWVYSTALAATIITSFIIFRLIGAAMIGELSETQISFILVEFIEAGLGIFLLLKYQPRAHPAP